MKASILQTCTFDEAARGKCILMIVVLDATVIVHVQIVRREAACCFVFSDLWGVGLGYAGCRVRPTRDRLSADRMMLRELGSREPRAIRERRRTRLDAGVERSAGGGASLV